MIQFKVKTHFYYKTFHHDNYWSAHPREFREEYPSISRSKVHNQYCDNIWDVFPEKTVEVFQNIDVPLFGFKVLAAGAIPVADGLRYAYENGSDFVCLGMFDFQIVQDVNTTIEVLNTLGPRQREWRA